MKLKLFKLLLFAIVLSDLTVQAQIDSVFVEKYYISDANYATDTIGGGIAAGSVTYRVFIDLAAGSKLLRVYGDVSHAIKFSSTTDFFNHKDRGKSYGKEISSTRLDTGTLALDTWITLGQASNRHLGILKNDDNDGSMIRFLVNSNPEMGIPLTSADGLLLVPLSALPANVTAQINGITMSSTTDTTIFGSLKTGRKFISTNFVLSGSGITGYTSDNKILLAQLTTKGELSFELNIEIEQKDGLYTKRVKYVARDPKTDEIENRFLTYPRLPPTCGCKNPDYLEFNKTLECHIQDSCKTYIVYGCTDPTACNYDPNANFNIPGVCCYPGRCNNRNINIVCPDIQVHDNDLAFSIYPNPAQDHVTVEISSSQQTEAQFIIYNSNGTILLTENLGCISNNLIREINISDLSNGLYFLRLSGEVHSITKTFIKN